jgi:DNA-binding beta-propeller fold protein YncE
MNKASTRLLAAVTASAATCALGLAIPQGAGASPRAGVHPSAAPGTRLWASRYNGPRNSDDAPGSIAVSAGGRRVFVTGVSVRSAAGDFGDYATVGYDARTGARLWARSYNGPFKGTDVATSVAVSPDGTRVFVTGYSQSAAAADDYATIAYSAATGAQLWIRRFGPGAASAVTVGRGGKTVFVTGASGGDFATVACRAATGARLWVRRYNGPGKTGDHVAGPQPARRAAVRDRVQRIWSGGRLRDGRLQRPHRRPAVGPALPRRAEHHRRRPLGGHQPARRQGLRHVRDR